MFAAMDAADQPQNGTASPDALDEIDLASVRRRLRGLFPGRSYAEIARELQGRCDICSETVRRYFTATRPTIAFVRGVAQARDVRLDWLLSGRGERTEELEKRRIVESLEPRELLAALLRNGAAKPLVADQPGGADDARPVESIRIDISVVPMKPSDRSAATGG